MLLRYLVPVVAIYDGVFPHEDRVEDAVSKARGFQCGKLRRIEGREKSLELLIDLQRCRSSLCHVPILTGGKKKMQVAFEPLPRLTFSQLPCLRGSGQRTHSGSCRSI